MKNNHMDSYLIAIEHGKNNYCAFSPDVPGCYTDGDTVEETLKNMREALEFHLEAEDSIPEPKGIAWHLQDDPDLSAQSLIFAYIPVEQVAPKMAHA